MSVAEVNESVSVGRGLGKEEVNPFVYLQVEKFERI